MKAELTELKGHFYCAGAAYLVECVPVEAKLRDGTVPWTAYISAGNVKAARDWLKTQRPNRAPRSSTA